MKNFFCTLFTVLLGFSTLMGQDKIKLTVKTAVPDTSKYVYLAHYRGYKQFIKVDSAKVHKGLLNFESKEEPWGGGMYLVVFSSSKYFELLVSGKEKDIFMEFDTTNFIQSVNFKKSPENNHYYAFRKFMNGKMEEAKALQEPFKDEKDENKLAAFRVKMGAWQEDLDKEIKKRANEHPDYFSSKMIKAGMDPEIPQNVPPLPDGKPNNELILQLYKAKYFANFDFSDARMVKTPYLELKLEKYFDNYVYPRPDSLKKETSKILDQSFSNEEVFKYTLSYLTQKYANTQVVGMDPVVIHLYDNYYLKKANWISDELRTWFKERVAVMKNVETGKVFPNLLLKDFNGKEYRLDAEKPKYTIVYFYDPGCYHCQQSAPHLAKFYEENKANGVRVWNIAAPGDKKDAEEFVEKYGLKDVLNLYDENHRYDFRNQYDIVTYPTSYILNSKLEIIGRKIGIEELPNFLEFYEKNNKD